MENRVLRFQSKHELWCCCFESDLQLGHSNDTEVGLIASCIHECVYRHRSNTSISKQQIKNHNFIGILTKIYCISNIWWIFFVFQRCFFYRNQLYALNQYLIFLSSFLPYALTFIYFSSHGCCCFFFYQSMHKCKRAARLVFSFVFFSLSSQMTTIRTF